VRNPASRAEVLPLVGVFDQLAFDRPYWLAVANSLEDEIHP
jgi:hypothetical protein